MFNGRKQTPSPFTWCKKRKAWNKTRAKHMPVKKRQNLGEQTGDHITKRNG